MSISQVYVAELVYSKLIWDFTFTFVIQHILLELKTRGEKHNVIYMIIVHLWSDDTEKWY